MEATFVKHVRKARPLQPPAVRAIHATGGNAPISILCAVLLQQVRWA